MYQPSLIFTVGKLHGKVTYLHIPAGKSYMYM